MHYKVVFLHQAKLDLQYLKNYILKNFTLDTWKTSYKKIKDAVNTLKTFPEAGSIPSELEDLNLNQYRQVIADLNRIIYEIRQNIIYIHIVCDSRKEMKSLLTRRLLRVV